MNSRYGDLNARSFPAYARELAAQFPEIDGILASCGLPKFWSRQANIETLFRIILEQQVSLAAARTLFKRVSHSIGGMTAHRVYQAGPDTLRSLGISRQKSRYCYELARAVVERRLSIAGLSRMSDEEAIEKLCVQPGIGPWSASIYLISALKRIDVWAPGDLALQRGIEDLFPAKDTKALVEDGARWRPWRAVAARLVWHHYLSNMTTRKTPS
ncbi:MAG: DNA-3-methyladenine glycosylase 2 family protein [Gammaproteobacteria bacterium]|nr:DNA-3-methyladenine glycosylase 2 family protein [Gammaproteobacteria bacterium]